MDSPPTEQEIHIPAGRSVRVRPIPRSEDLHFQRRAMASGRLDVNLLQQLRFRYAVIEPSFTMDEVAAIFERFGPSVQIILDQIEEISGGPSVHADPRLPRSHRQALKMAATATQAMRRGDHRPRVRPRQRRGCNTRTRGSRRTSRSTRAGPDDDGGESEPPGLKLWRHPKWGACSPDLLCILLWEGRS